MHVVNLAGKVHKRLLNNVSIGIWANLTFHAETIPATLSILTGAADPTEVAPVLGPTLS